MTSEEDSQGSSQDVSTVSYIDLKIMHLGYIYSKALKTNKDFHLSYQISNEVV